MTTSNNEQNLQSTELAKSDYTGQMSYFVSGSLFVCNMYPYPRCKNQLPQTNLIRNLQRNKTSTAKKSTIIGI